MSSSRRGETLVSLREASAHLPTRRGKKVHYSTIFRWATKGARGLKLDSWLIGGVRYTTVEALERFSRSHPFLGTDEDMAAVERSLDQAGL